MKRRTFLKATLATAGALMSGCDSSSGSGDGTGGAGDGGGEPATYLDGAAYFPHSLASGDPHATSVILWTRPQDADTGDADLTVGLHVALDAEFTQRVSLDGGDELALTAEAAFDHCVKVRVTDLEPATTYWYRFVYTAPDGETYTTRSGRTRTAPAADADVPVRFAVVSCQDFNGRYYNTYRILAEQDIDFFVHLGDYVYETTGDRLFQDATAERVLVFSDKDGAIAFNAGSDEAYFAASSLSNYREMYKTVRTDADLQRVHELFAMIAIYDDHEFSDDSHGTVGTYFDGAQDEDDPVRRSHADRAWFEYMPVDYQGDPDFVYSDAVAFPDDLRIYRDFTFGQHMHLVMTDERRYRSDHVIEEDGFPGAVAATQSELEAALGELPAVARPYLDVDAHDGGALATLLKAEAEALGLEPADITGLLSVDWINSRLEDLNEGLDEADWHPLVEEAGHALGVAYHQVFKTGRYSAIGSRYLVVAEPFDAVAAARWHASGGASELALGDTQRQWFLDTLGGSTSTWKIWGNEYTFIPRDIDLRGYDFLPEDFQVLFHLTVEDWDGLPNRRAAMTEALAGVDNLVIVTGDVHAFFAGSWGEGANKAVEFVTGAVSSASYKTLLVRQAEADPALVAVGAPILAAQVGDLLRHPESKPNPHLAYAGIDQHGFMVLEASADSLRCTMHRIPEEHASARITDNEALAALFDPLELRVDVGSRELHRLEDDGSWTRWDPDAFDWV